MERILYNKDNLTKEDINKEITRMKVLLINDNNEVMIGYSGNVYMFIGGHLEKNESFLDCLNREIEEETGMELDLKNLNPFLKTEMYCKNYFQKGINVNCIIYFFAVRCNSKINLKNTNYTEEEIVGNFEIKKIKLDNFEKEIISNYEKYPLAKGIGIELLNAMKVYKSLNQ